MTKVNSSTFGSITIDGVTYNHDIYILPSGKVVERKYGHTFTKDQVENVLRENPDIVVAGKGTSGLASLSSDARALSEEKGIEIIEANTPAIVDTASRCTPISILIIIAVIAVVLAIGIVRTFE